MPEDLNSCTGAVIDYTDVASSTITMNFGLYGLTTCPGGIAPGYPWDTENTIVLLHEYGHAAWNAGDATVVQPDLGNTTQSMQNTDAIENACFPQGDSPNVGPADGGQAPVNATRIAHKRKHF